MQSTDSLLKSLKYAAEQELGILEASNRELFAKIKKLKTILEL
jgi:cell division protein FtsB